MDYLLAILGLSTACVLWYWVQRWAGLDEDGEADGPDCEECDRRGESCPAPPPASRIGR